MLITFEMILSIITALAIGKYSELKSPKLYDVIATNGQTYNIQIHNSAKNPCPLHCGTDHYHRVELIDSKIESNGFYSLSGYEDSNAYINSYAILDIEEVKIEKKGSKNKLKPLNVQTYLP